MATVWQKFMQIYLSSDLLLSLSLHIFVSVWLIKSLVHVGSVYRMTSLAVSRFSLQLAYIARSYVSTATGSSVLLKGL